MLKPFIGAVKIDTVRKVLDGYFKVNAVKLSFEGFDGTMITPQHEILSFERGDAVAALVHDTENDTLVLIEQFRYPTFAKTNGWIIEIVAGKLDDEDNPTAEILRELLEETGYEASEAEHIHTFYVSPGGTSERIILYYVAVTPQDKSGPGGGLGSETEDIRIHEVSIDTAFNMLKKGHIMDAKTIIALQWFKLQQCS